MRRKTSSRGSGRTLHVPGAAVTESLARRTAASFGVRHISPAALARRGAKRNMPISLG
jgi:hypothetical protein